jgi:ribosomal protein S18 acetylase RimI-like enzyme
MAEMLTTAATSDGLAIVPLPADFDQWEELLALILSSFRYMNDIIDPPSSALRLTPENLEQKAAEETAFLALLDGRMVGCVFLAEKNDHFYLGKLAVDPACQGRGIGGRLVAAAEEHVRSTAKPAIELQVRIELVNNQATFHRLGFRETVRTAHAGYDRLTSITMRKELRA